MIESIFKTYPAVRRKHLQHVPANMTEQDFWTGFFQSHYFHRDRVLLHVKGDLFAECAKEDDRSIREQLKAGVKDRVADVGAFSDATLDENYGATGANPFAPLSAEEKAGRKAAAASAAASAATSSAAASANIVQQVRRETSSSMIVVTLRPVVTLCFIHK